MLSIRSIGSRENLVLRSQASQQVSPRGKTNKTLSFPTARSCRMLERAKDTTCYDKYTYIDYAILRMIW
jgi:hypothetical protein